MGRAAVTFFTLTVAIALLAALSIALRIKGYPFGGLGLDRLDGIANSATFMPLAALYAFAAMLMMILPVRAAGFVYLNAAQPIWLAAIVLLATIVGVQVARVAFGDRNALWVLVDWKFVFAAAIIAVHFVLDALRRNILLRTLFFVVFLVATLACLYWTFRL
ncbi:MAG: hypothetical protein WBA44_09340 [Mesorhizobium sp.]